jgi:DNA-binding MarR family transcriptional regulator
MLDTLPTDGNRAGSRRSDGVGDDIDAVHVAIRLRASVAGLGRQLRATAADDGPGMAKLGVLGQLYRLGPMTPTRLAQRERVRLQTLTRLLAELAAERLIRRRADPDDARRTMLSIAPAGVRLLTADIRRREASLTAAIATQLDVHERHALLAACRLIDRVGEVLSEGTDP